MLSHYSRNVLGEMSIRTDRAKPGVVGTAMGIRGRYQGETCVSALCPSNKIAGFKSTIRHQIDAYSRGRGGLRGVRDHGFRIRHRAGRRRAGLVIAVGI